MGKDNIISVVDIGTTKVVVIIARCDAKDKFTILGMGHEYSRGVSRGNVKNIIETTTAIKKAKEKAEASANIKIKEVYVGIAGQNICVVTNKDHYTRQNFNNEITQKEIDNFIQAQKSISINHGYDVVQIIPEYFEIDNEKVLNPIGYVGKELSAKFHIVTSHIQNINNIKRAIEAADLKLKRLFLEPIASAKSVLFDEEFEAGVIMIDIGGGTTDLAVYNQHRLIHTAVFPFGGNTVTLDIQQIFGLTWIEAEELKKIHGKAIPQDSDNDEIIVIPKQNIGRAEKQISLYNLSATINARILEILGFIEKEIKTYNIKNIGAGIVITGGGSLLKDMPQLTSFKLGLETRIGTPIISVNSEYTDLINNPQYATVLGLLSLAYDNIQKENQPEEKVKTDEQINDKINDVIIEKNVSQEAPRNKKEKKWKEKVFGKLGNISLGDIFLINDSKFDNE